MEKRQFGRRESAIHAVVLVGGRAPAHCIVRNFSERGALLEFNAPFAPPFRFRLVVDAKAVDVLCEVRHQTRHGVGVFFVSGSVSGLFEGSQKAADPNGLPPRAPEMQKPMAVRTSGTDLRSALFGSRQREAVTEGPVRTFDADAGGIIRGT
jgi:PilZ domain